jgi:nuclear GTP-binding protein
VYSLHSTSQAPTTTFAAQEIPLQIGVRDVRLVDTPGSTWSITSDEDRSAHRIRDVLLRSKGRIDRLKDPVPAGQYLAFSVPKAALISLIIVADIVIRSHTEDLMIFYKVPAFSKGDFNTFLNGVARANHLVKKVQYS